MRIVILIFIFSSKLFSQEINYQIYFLEKDIKIGDSIKLVSIINYPKEIELIQPDSSFQFFPFSFVKKENFESKLNERIISDSSLYILRSFEIDSIQAIRLNSFILNGKDCLEISSNYDTVYFNSLVNNTDQKVKKNISFNEILSIINTYKLSLYSIIFICLILALYLLFRKKIIAYFRKRKVLKSHALFNKEFEKIKKQFKTNADKNNLEKIILIWKRYIEKLTSIPYSSMTTKEIIDFFDNENLIKSLKYIDEMIYSDKLIEMDKFSFKYLLDYADSKTKELIKKIENE